MITFFGPAAEAAPATNKTARAAAPTVRRTAAPILCLHVTFVTLTHSFALLHVADSWHDRSDRLSWRSGSAPVDE
jgi:hypothetical protein